MTLTRHEEFLKAAMQALLSNPHWTQLIDEAEEDDTEQLEVLYQQSLLIANRFEKGLRDIKQKSVKMKGMVNE